MTSKGKFKPYYEKYKKDPKYMEQKRAYTAKYHELHKDDPEYKARQNKNHARWQRENKERLNAYQRERRRAIREREAQQK